MAAIVFHEAETKYSARMSGDLGKEAAMDFSDKSQRRTDCTPDRERDRSLLPVAYQRAPTLMTAGEAGGHGDVQVWGPDKSALRIRNYQDLVAFAAMNASPWVLRWFVLQAHLTGPQTSLALRMTLLVIAMTTIFWGKHAAALAAHRRPKYLTTDSAGIGVTLARGSRYLRWDQIVSARFETAVSTIVLSSPSQQIRLSLYGFRGDDQSALWDVITRCAQLQPVDSWKHCDRRARPNHALPSGTETPGLLAP